MATERDFNSADDEMLERAQVFHDRLTPELPDFTARLPWLDAAWLSGFQSNIDAADAFPKDQDVTLDMKVLTGDVTSTMQQGYAALQTLGGYARLTYPDDEARQRVFGQQYWPSARYTTLKLQEALELAYTKANTDPYKTDLIAKGYTQADIDQLNTMAIDLQNRNGLQESAKAGRKVTSSERIKLLNSVWMQMRTINQAAEVVWAGDEARREQYALYPASSSNSSDQSSISVKGRAFEDGTQTPLPNVEVRMYPTIDGDQNSMIMFTGPEGNYEFYLSAQDSPTEPMEVTLEFRLDGHETTYLDTVVQAGTHVTDMDAYMPLQP